MFLIVFVSFYSGLIDADEANISQDIRRIEESIQKAAMECYAIEGYFPEDLAYLEEEYGLIYNKKEYSIMYRVDGSNLMPDIYVYRKGEGV